MNVPKYEVFDIDDFTVQFYSRGCNGDFTLRIFFTCIYQEAGREVYNLGFGVWDEEAEMLDDLLEINNGDSEQILATVAYVALQFLFERSHAYLYAEGSTSARTRRYQMGINKYLYEIENDFVVKGGISYADDLGNSRIEWQDLVKGTNYSAFLLHRRHIII